MKQDERIKMQPHTKFKIADKDEDEQKYEYEFKNWKK